MLGVSSAYKCRKGLAHERVDVLASDEFFNSSFFQATSMGADLLSPDSKRANPGAIVAPMPSMQLAMQEVMAGRGASDEEDDGDDDLSFAQKVDRKKKELQESKREWADFERDRIKRAKRKGLLEAKAKAQRRTQVGFGRGGASPPRKVRQ